MTTLPGVRHAPGLRLRPVPELSTCLAYTPQPPRLHTLNPSAWLIMELSRDGGRDLEQDYVSRTAPPLSADDARRQLREGLADLEAAGLLHIMQPEEDTP